MIAGKDKGRFKGVSVEVVIDKDGFPVVEEFLYKRFRGWTCRFSVLVVY